MNVQTKKQGFVEDEKLKEAIPTEPIAAPVEPEEPEIVQEVWPVVVKLLYRPIQTPDKGTIKELSFREPRGGDINRLGCPVRVDQNGDIVIDDKKMLMMMAALSGVLPPFLESMDPRDWCSCTYRLRSFFLPDPRAW